MKYTVRSFEEIFSLDSLFKSFKEFERGKKYKSDVAEFKSRLVENLLLLHSDIMSGNYRHGGYFYFKVSDPKPRDIHKASVRDRVVHHALYRVLYPYFDQKFIFDSYSCRQNKGTHRALRRFEEFGRAESQNYTRTVWVLKCDIRKCFASVDKEILKHIIHCHVSCSRTIEVIFAVIDSFSLGNKNKAIPLGNLTSQLFINVYLYKLDFWIKRIVKVKKYIRYADDFVLFSENKKELESFLSHLNYFLKTELKLETHQDKVFIKTLASGVDFLGWVHFPRYRILRKKTKHRMLKKIQNKNQQTISSYKGLLSHGNAYKLTQFILG